MAAGVPHIRREADATGRKNTRRSLTVFCMWLVKCAVVGEHKHVCGKAMLMMLLQLPVFWSGAAAAVVVVVVAIGCVCFKLLPGRGPGSPEELPYCCW